MGIRWRTFEVPKRIEVDKGSLTPTYGRFIAEPFEKSLIPSLRQSRQTEPTCLPIRFSCASEACSHCEAQA